MSTDQTPRPPAKLVLQIEGGNQIEIDVEQVPDLPTDVLIDIVIHGVIEATGSLGTRDLLAGFFGRQFVPGEFVRPARDELARRIDRSTTP